MPKNTRRDTHKTRKSHLPQLETKKPIFLNQKLEKNFSKNVSGKLHSAENPKEWTFWGFLTSIMLQNFKKLKVRSLKLYSLLPYPKKLEHLNFSNKIKIEKFEQPHSAEKFESGNLLEFFNIHSVANFQKIQVGPFREKKIEKSQSRKRESLIVSKKVESGTLLHWNGFVFHVTGFECVQNEVLSTYGTSA